MNLVAALSSSLPVLHQQAHWLMHKAYILLGANVSIINLHCIMLPTYSGGLDDAAMITNCSAETDCHMFAVYCCCCFGAVDMDVWGAMKRGGLDWQITLCYAAVCYVAHMSSELRNVVMSISAQFTILQKMYFAFGTGMESSDRADGT